MNSALSAHRSTESGNFWTLHREATLNWLALGMLQIVEQPRRNSALSAQRSTESGNFWTLHREATLNWLALGMLLAAWNASNDIDGRQVNRPSNLRGYPYVSVRAARVNNWTSHKSVNVL